MRFKLAFVSLLVALLSLVLAAPALAAQRFQPTWEEALHFVVGPGAAVLAGLIISVLIEYWARFQALEHKWKVLIYISLCVVLALLGQAAAIATHIWGSWNDVQTTWWPALWAGFAASGIGTLFHAWVPSPLRLSK
jgi:hypothetical protein